MTMHVLVTGGAGYIGSHTARALAGAGFSPVVVDNLSTGHDWAVKWGPLVVADLADRGALESVFDAYPIQAVIHFAASAYVGESMQNPGLYFRNNVANTAVLLEAMRAHAVDRIVFSSSCATYGYLETVPVAEDHRQSPVSPYGESKLMVERMLYWFARIHGFRAVALRYFNAAGADPEGEIGETHDPETHLIPRAIQAALGCGPMLDLYGDDYPTPDGSAVRDYIHVSDLATAHVAALGHLEHAEGLLAFNLGAGVGHSVKQVIAMVEAVGGRSVPCRVTARRPGDPAALIADARRATDVLRWQPQLSSLRTIVETAWAWQVKSTAPRAG